MPKIKEITSSGYSLLELLITTPGLIPDDSQAEFTYFKLLNVYNKKSYTVNAIKRENLTGIDFVMKDRKLYPEEDVVDLSNLTLISYLEHNLKDAEKYCKEIIKLHPEPVYSASAYNNLAIILERENKPKEASRTFNKAKKIINRRGAFTLNKEMKEKSLGLLYYNFSRFLTLHNKLKDAEKVLERATNYIKSNSFLYLALGDVYLLRKNFTGARFSYGKADSLIRGKSVELMQEKNQAEIREGILDSICRRDDWFKKKSKNNSMKRLDKRSKQFNKNNENKLNSFWLLNL